AFTVVVPFSVAHAHKSVPGATVVLGDIVFTSVNLNCDDGNFNFYSNPRLTAETTYYYRAYATNNEATSYGSEENFTTSVSTSPTTMTCDAESFADGQEMPDNHNFSAIGKTFNIYAGTFDGGISGEGGMFYDPGDGSV